MDRLNFNHFYYFYIVAKEGSVKATAEKLHVSQPTVSDQIKLLEEFFDCKLFERKNRGLYLTTEGHMALEYAEKAFSLSRELTSRLRNKVRLPKTTLDIGMSLNMAPYFMYDSILPLFDHNEFTVNIVENERHLLLAELEEGNIDIVISNTREGIFPSMKASKIGKNRTYVLAHKSFRKHRKNFPSSLNEIPFFNYSQDSELRYEIELYFSKYALSPRSIGEGDDIDLFEVIVKSGKGFVMVPEVGKNRICQNKDVIVLGEIEDLETTTWCITKKDYQGPVLNLM
jgi:LysR family transcriptional regulator, transcriptional activator of nhaA